MFAIVEFDGRRGKEVDFIPLKWILLDDKENINIHLLSQGKYSRAIGHQ